MLKRLLSPEFLSSIAKPEQGLIRSVVHKRKLEMQHALPAMESAVNYMLNEGRQDVVERVRNWAVKHNFFPAEQANLPDEYIKEVHENGIDIHKHTGEEALRFAQTAFIAPNDLSTLESTPQTAAAKAASQRELDARTALHSAHDTHDIPLPPEFRDGNTDQSFLEIV